jgi:hypothetical protein
MPVGWNMVGYKSRVDYASDGSTDSGYRHTVGQYFGWGTGASTTTTIYNIPITAFDAPSQSFTTRYLGDNLTSGQGYWIYYNTAGTITPPPD